MHGHVLNLRPHLLETSSYRIRALLTTIHHINP